MTRLSAQHFLLSALLVAGSPWGTAVASAQQVAEATPSAAAPIEKARRASLFGQAPVSEGALAHVSGREDRPTWQSSNSQNSAQVKDNSVGDNSPTGSLTVADSAFQNVSGISMVNLNTGNASSINASLNVNVAINMAPPTGLPSAQ